MLNRKRKYLILPTIYALYDADFVFERLSQKIMKSLKKQSSSRGLPFTSAPTSGVTDPPEDIQDTCMLHRKRKYLILSIIYALSGADFVFERLSQKIVKSLKK